VPDGEVVRVVDRLKRSGLHDTEGATLRVELVVDLPPSIVFGDAILAAGRASAPDRYGVVLRKDSRLTNRVNDAVRALTTDGTLSRLQKRWLTTDLRRLPVLR
jgi:polar amino acid transport system substrate-binding protein